MSERDSLATQLRAHLTSISDAPSANSGVAPMLIHWLRTAADRLDVLEQEKTTHRWVQHSNSRDAESLAACQRELAAARDWSDLLTRGKSPCGHWSAHAVTEDGGKLVTCLDCDIASLKLRAEAAEAERDRYKAAIDELLAEADGTYVYDWGGGGQATRQSWVRAVCRTALSPHETP